MRPRSRDRELGGDTAPAAQAEQQAAAQAEQQAADEAAARKKRNDSRRGKGHKPGGAAKAAGGVNKPKGGQPGYHGSGGRGGWGHNNPGPLHGHWQERQGRPRERRRGPPGQPYPDGPGHGHGGEGYWQEEPDPPGLGDPGYGQEQQPAPHVPSYWPGPQQGLQGPLSHQGYGGSEMGLQQHHPDMQYYGQQGCGYGDAAAQQPYSAMPQGCGYGGPAVPQFNSAMQPGVGFGGMVMPFGPGLQLQQQQLMQQNALLQQGVYANQCQLRMLQAELMCGQGGGMGMGMGVLPMCAQPQEALQPQPDQQLLAAAGQRGEQQAEQQPPTEEPPAAAGRGTSPPEQEAEPILTPAPMRQQSGGGRSSYVARHGYGPSRSGVLQQPASEQATDQELLTPQQKERMAMQLVSTMSMVAEWMRPS